MRLLSAEISIRMVPALFPHSLVSRLCVQRSAIRLLSHRQTQCSAICIRISDAQICICTYI